MVLSIKKEIEFYGNYNKAFFEKNEICNTIYLGGGTPSILSVEQLKTLIDSIFENYTIAPNSEITIETNPDNLSFEYCKNLFSLGFNRLSIGIQSFYDEHLKWMNRSHNANQANECITNAKNVGFNNISIDLIYGFPGLTDEQWKHNLSNVEKMGINHLSCYSLTVEEKTPLKKLIDTGRYQNIEENKQANQFRYLQDWAIKHNWEHYEISNLCKNNNYSVHNCSYWKNEKYLGIGPSAHSYNFTERRWNVANNNEYIETIAQNCPLYTSENLSKKEKYNDYIITSLRTVWGIDIRNASLLFGFDILIHFNEILKNYTESGLLEIDEIKIKLSNKGMLFADKIASDLFLI